MNDEELVITFDTDTILHRYQDLSRYMTYLAVTGVAGKAKLRPRNDRWNILETAIVPPKPDTSSSISGSTKTTPSSTLLGSPNGRKKVPNCGDNSNSPSLSPVTTPSSRYEPPTTPVGGTPVVLGSGANGKRKQMMSKACPSSPTTRSTKTTPCGTPVGSPSGRNMRKEEDLLTQNVPFFVESDDCFDELADISVPKMKEILVFAFYVPVYGQHDEMIHGSGSVAEEIKLIKAFDDYNNTLQLKPITAPKSCQNSTKTPTKRGNPHKKSHAFGTILPPLDAYGTFDDKRSAKGSTRSDSRTLLNHSLSSILNLPSVSSLSSRGNREKEKEGSSAFEVYNPVAIPKDFKLYNPVRNTTSW
jgi:hypothetical protein